jgi:beta-phosphoglucomutase
MIKGFLFDLDGVIVDTAIFHFKAWKRLANELSFDIDEEFNETLKGISRMDSLDAILKHGNCTLNIEDKIKYATLKNEWYLDLVEQMGPKDILPGIKEFFEEFKAINIKCALGSASKNAPKILEKIGLLKNFDAIIDGNSVQFSKPHPEVFLKGAEALSLSNHECLVFEDAFAGIEAAKAANMKAIGIGNYEVLNNADLVFKSTLELSISSLKNILY